jgi:hypothetical protein
MRMTDSLEFAKEDLHHAAHGAGHQDGSARKVAVLIAVLAAGLALCEMAEKGAQNAYLTQHIQAADDWAFYQAKTIRANLYITHAETLEALGKPADKARETAARLNDDPKGGEGRVQLLAKAKLSEGARDHSFHNYHLFEGAVGALQIAIVLASVSVVTRVGALALGAGVLGLGAVVFAGLVAAGVL